MHAPVRTVAPALLPVDIQDIRNQVSMTEDDHDELLHVYLAAAVAHLDGPTGVLGRCLITQTWRQDFDAWAGELRLPVPDAASANVSYTDAAGAPQVVDAGLWDLVNTASAASIRFRRAFTYPPVGPEVSGVRVTFVAGFGATSSQVPAAIRAAIMAHVAHMFGNRETVVVGTGAAELPMSHAALIAPYRRGLV